jgi:MerR family copper efflux transcriptional regulator
LISPVTRSGNGYRQYNKDSIQRILFIRKSQSLGFTLKEIRTLLTMHHREDVTCAAMLTLTQQKIAETQRKVQELQHIERALQTLSITCPGDGSPLSDCPILAHLQNHSLHYREKNP